MLRNITSLRIDSVQPKSSPQTSEDLLYDEVRNGITSHLLRNIQWFLAIFTK